MTDYSSISYHSITTKVDGKVERLATVRNMSSHVLPLYYICDDRRTRVAVLRPRGEVGDAYECRFALTPGKPRCQFGPGDLDVRMEAQEGRAYDVVYFIPGRFHYDPDDVLDLGMARNVGPTIERYCMVS